MREADGIRRARFISLAKIPSIIAESSINFDTKNGWYFAVKHLLWRKYTFYIKNEKGLAVGVLAVEKRSKQHWHLEVMVVRRAFRGRGYGKALLGHARQEAAKSGVSELTCYVDEKNYPSLKMCYAEGYSVVGTRENMLRMCQCLSAQPISKQTLKSVQLHK